MHKNFKGIEKTVFGRGSFSQLGTIVEERRHENDKFMLYLVDQYFKGKELERKIPAQKQDLVIYIDVDPEEPSTKQIDNLRDAVKKSHGTPAAVIGIGGGSIMDIAKAVSLMFTNDGEMTKKLTHPASNIFKVYHIELDKPLTHEHLNTIAEGLELEDGFIKVDEIAYDDEGAGDKRMVGVELHSGKNRVVRRLFEHFEYEVRRLDRVIFAGLTKKDLPRGRWRFLTEEEINMLFFTKLGINNS